jgi:hypothetical protein
MAYKMAIAAARGLLFWPLSHDPEKACVNDIIRQLAPDLPQSPAGTPSVLIHHGLGLC